jgi:hypothetical protein
MQLVIWTTFARSLVFNDVTNFNYHSQGIEFDYVGGSTGVKRHANFNNTAMAGYATTDKIESVAK